MPVRTAAPLPRLRSWRRTRSRGVAGSTRLATAAVPSVEPSSTTMISSCRARSAATRARRPARWCPPRRRRGRGCVTKQLWRHGRRAYGSFARVRARRPRPDSGRRRDLRHHPARKNANACSDAKSKASQRRSAGAQGPQAGRSRTEGGRPLPWRQRPAATSVALARGGAIAPAQRLALEATRRDPRDYQGWIALRDRPPAPAPPDRAATAGRAARAVAEDPANLRRGAGRTASPRP